MNTKVNKKLHSGIEVLYKNYKRSFEIFYNSYREGLNKNYNIVFADYIAFLDYIKTQNINRGGLQTIRIVKLIRLIVYKVLASDVIPEGSFLRTYKNKIPRALGPKISYAISMKDEHTIRCLLTLLQISYIVPDIKAPNIEPIVAKSNADPNTIKSIGEWIKLNYKKFFTLKPRSFWDEPHVSTKAGPLGPAVWTIPNELFLLSENTRKNISILGGPKLEAWLDNCYSSRQYLLDAQKYIYEGEIQHKYRSDSLRRLTFIKAPEGKARVIAVIDWWTQTSLKALHNWSFDQLKALNNDATFDQSSFLTKLPKVGPYFSFDLTGATDRFPVEIQEIFLCNVLGEKRSKAWRSLLCDEEYLVSWNGSYVKYGSGQPMGAYSSWSIFSLCHHLVVQYCAQMVSKPAPFEKYCILGDDIVIADREVANEYKKVINLLGVEIDPTKSLVSIDTYEFAKRIIHKGKEITAFPLSAMIENHKSISALWSTTIIARERGFNIPAVSYPGFIAELQRACGMIYRSSVRHAKDFEALYIIKQDKDHEYLPWALQHMNKTIDRYLPCRSNISSLKEILLYDLGYFSMRYKALLLENRYKRFQMLTFRLTGGAYLKGGIEGMGSQAHAPIDLMRVPIVWVAYTAIKQQEYGIQDLKVYGGQQNWAELLRLKIAPIGDLNRIVSRQTNLESTAMQSKLVRFFRKEQAYLNSLIKDTLSS